MKPATALALLLTAAVAHPARAVEAGLIVHEWGTFTSFQDDRGVTIAGINVDDEPVPAFVHRLEGLPVFTTRSLPATWSQGAPRCHPDVTLRLETPVVYFYPQAGFPPDKSIELRATFAGGWLTEYFPVAASDNAGFPGTLVADSRGSLHWNNLKLGRDASRVPQTDASVWLAPRQVASAVVSASASHEVEKYVFYRGVGHVDAPLVVQAQGNRLRISLHDANAAFPHLPLLWMVHVLPDDRVAYRRLESGGSDASATIPAAGGAGESRLRDLEEEIRRALVAEGLFDDEARAMLATWKLSYFESEGLRIFYILPRAWTDARLPLNVSPPASMTRVMLGRIELASPHQLDVLDKLLKLPDSAFDIPPLYAESRDAYARMLEGGASHSELYRGIGRDPPAALTLYESLGRFRDALLVHEQQRADDPVRRGRLARIVEKFGSCDPR